jgi:hypothetical protein
MAALKDIIMIAREREANDELMEAIVQFAGKSPAERAYNIISAYCRLFNRDEAVSGLLHEVYTNWLFSPVNREAKDRALKRVFNEDVSLPFSEI